MRNKNKIAKADLILTGDWHLQEKTPVARTDNFIETQWKKVKFIADLSEQHDCAVVHSGDLFDHWKPSPELLSRCNLYLPRQFWTVYGNHDLPQHNLELVPKCGVYTLHTGERINVLTDTHFGKELTECSFTWKDRQIAVWHVFTYQGKVPWPGCEAMDSKSLMKKYREYDLILTGDNHQTFVEERRGRLLVNPGSIFRTSAAQIDHKPCVFLYYADTNTVEPVYLPIEQGVISREHIERKEQRESRIDAFISSLNTEYESDVNFLGNLKRFYSKNKTKKEVKELILKFID